jgi:hypothetical protein
MLLPCSLNSALTCNQKFEVRARLWLAAAKVPFEGMLLRNLAEPRAVASMKIRSHSESHLVELDDGSKWQIFPGDLDVTLNWKPDTDLKLVRIDDPTVPMRWSAVMTTIVSE